MEVQQHQAFLTLALEGGELSASCPDFLPPAKELPIPPPFFEQEIGVGTEPVWTLDKERKKKPRCESDHKPSVVYP